MNVITKSIIECKLQFNRSPQGELIRQTFQALKDPRIQLADLKAEAIELPVYCKEDGERMEDVSSVRYQAKLPSGYTVGCLRDPRKRVVAYELLLLDPVGCPVVFTRGYFSEMRAHWYLEGRYLVGNPDETHEERRSAKERNDRKLKTSEVTNSEEAS